MIKTQGSRGTLDTPALPEWNMLLEKCSPRGMLGDLEASFQEPTCTAHL